MRRWVLLIGFAALAALAGAQPARAEGINNFLAGVNGLLTFPADPIVSVISPPEAFEELPAHQVTGRVVGLFQGTILGAYRAMMGVVDIAFTPVWVFPTLSPEARFEIIPGYEVEYEEF